MSKWLVTSVCFVIANLACAFEIIPTDTPLSSFVGVGETIYGEYLLQGAPGQTIIFGHQLIPQIRQVRGEQADEYCTPVKTTLPASGYCKIRVRCDAPNDLTRPILEGALMAYIENSISSKIQHEIAIRVINFNVKLTPETLNIAQGKSQQFTAVGAYATGTTKNLTSAIRWSSSDEDIIDIDESGLATAINVGNATITAKYAGREFTSSVQVTEPELQTLSIIPAEQQIPQGLRQIFTAFGYYSDDETRDVSQKVAWNANGEHMMEVDIEGAVIIDKNLGNCSSLVQDGIFTVTGQKVGDCIISAALDDKTSLATLYIIPAELVSIMLNAPSATLAQGLTQDFTAIGIYTNGSHCNITDQVRWLSSNREIANIDTTGLFASKKVGQTTVSAVLANKQANVDVQVTEPELVSIVIIVPVKNIIQGESEQYRAQGTYTDGSSKDLTKEVTWSSSNRKVADVKNAGTLFGREMGDFNVTAYLSGKNDTKQLRVIAAELIGLKIVPEDYVLVFGRQAQPFKVIGIYTDNTEQDLTKEVSWSVNDSNVATIDSSGKVDGQGVGRTTIRADIADTEITAQAALHVMPKELVTITIGPENPQVAQGLTQQFTAQGTYTDGSVGDITDKISWKVPKRNIAVIEASGVATGKNIGTTNIVAELDGKTAHTMLYVTPAELVDITIEPVASNLAKGKSWQLTVKGTYTDGSSKDLTREIDWNVSSDAVKLSKNTGIALGDKIGGANVTVSLLGKNSTIQLNVDEAELTDLKIMPEDYTLVMGKEEQPFSVIGIYTDKTMRDLTHDVSWSTHDTGIATVDSSGKISGQSVGSTTVHATIANQEITAHVTLHVAHKELVTLTLIPENPQMIQGLTQQFIVRGTYTDGSEEDITEKVSWKSQNRNVAVIEASGMATSKSVGTTVITAEMDGRTAHTTLQVTDAELVDLTITPIAFDIARGEKLQLTALGKYTDGTQQDLTKEVVWNSQDETIAIFNKSPGLIVGKDPGQVNVTASLDNKNCTTQLHVTSAQLTAIKLMPEEYFAAQGKNDKPFTVIGIYTDDTEKDITRAVSWRSSDNDVATVNNSGHVKAKDIGKTLITATVGTTNVVGQAAFYVTDKELVVITVTPGSATVPQGWSQDFIAEGYYSDGSKEDITKRVSWSVNHRDIAMLESSGRATGKQLGKVDITARFMELEGTTRLSVTEKELVSIEVKPQDVQLVEANIKQLTAWGTYTDGSTVEVTDQVRWNTSDKKKATVNKNGMLTALGSGVVTISAGLTGKQGVTNIYIKEGVITSPPSTVLSQPPVSTSDVTSQPGAKNTKSMEQTRSATVTLEASQTAVESDVIPVVQTQTTQAMEQAQSTTTTTEAPQSATESNVAQTITTAAKPKETTASDNQAVDETNNVTEEVSTSEP